MSGREKAASAWTRAGRDGGAVPARGTARLLVIYPALGTKKPKATTVQGGAAAWSLTNDVSLRPTLVTSNTGWRLVQLRFNAGTGATGDWRVDDVLIDPRMR